MSETHETDAAAALRRAMEAQAAATGKIDVAAVDAALQSGDPIPPDEQAVAEQQAMYGDWREELPDDAEPLSEQEQAMIQPQLPLGGGSEPSSGVRLARNDAYDDSMSIRDARVRLAGEMQAGSLTNCPCCGCFAHVAKRSIHVAQAVGLIKIFRAGGGQDYVDTAAITHNDARVDVAKSKWWDLIEELPESRRPDGGRAGWWRLTPTGVAFVMRQAKVTKYAHIFDNEVQWRSGERVGIEDCLRNQFDWQELMYG